MFSANSNALGGITKRNFTLGLAQFLSIFAVLVGGLLVSAQLQYEFSLRETLSGDYWWIRLEYFLMLAAVSGLTHLVVFLVSPAYRRSANNTAQWRLIVLLVSMAIAVVTFMLIWPQIYLLQLIYFAVSSILLGLIVFVLPSRLAPESIGNNLGADLSRLWQRRTLLRIWLVYNIRSRYSQALLGIFWIILLPISTSLVLALVFSEIVRTQVSNVPFAVFVLVGLVPWGLFSYGVITSTRSILSATYVINQVYFPREILVLVTIGEGVLDLLITFLAMILINAANGIWPNALFIWLPVLLLIHISLTLGIMFFVSCLSVLVRDIPPLVAVGMQLLFYLTPIIYPLERLPAKYRILALVNPLAPIVEAFRDIVIQNRPPNWFTLYYPAVLSIALLYVGYTFFKAHEHQFADLS
jgi:lipopolysaccharide transport system permease protein